jgi:hypothetical protein
MSTSKYIPRFLSNWQTWKPQCTSSTCSSKTLFQTITRRNRGMKVDDQWYCQDCIEPSVQAKILELMTSQGRAVRAHSSRIPLGLLLLQRGILTAEQLRIALDRHRLTEVNFGDVVQQLGFATGEQVTAAVAAQWACPVFCLGDRQLELGVRIPHLLLEMYGMLPVHFVESERRLLIAFVTGVQHQMLYTIGQMTSCTVAPCFITASEYESHLHPPSQASLRDNELVFEQIIETAEMARITSNYVGQLAAERLRLGRCRDYLWARIWGNTREMDLLFRLQPAQGLGER